MIRKEICGSRMQVAQQYIACMNLILGATQTHTNTKIIGKQLQYLSPYITHVLELGLPSPFTPGVLKLRPRATCGPLRIFIWQVQQAGCCLSFFFFNRKTVICRRGGGEQWESSGLQAMRGSKLRSPTTTQDLKESFGRATCTVICGQ